MSDYPAPVPGPSSPPMVEPVQINDCNYYCIELYLPKRLRYLSALYRYLQDALNHDPAVVALNGLSISEKDGAFRGRQQLWDERTLVIEILLPGTVDRPQLVHDGLIRDLGREIKALAPEEEQLWIKHYPVSVAIVENTEL